MELVALALTAVAWLFWGILAMLLGRTCPAANPPGDVRIVDVKLDSPAVCLICRTRIEAGTGTSCFTCSTPYHLECWRYNRGCATVGCWRSRRAS